MRKAAWLLAGALVLHGGCGSDAGGVTVPTTGSSGTSETSEAIGAGPSETTPATSTEPTSSGQTSEAPTETIPTETTPDPTPEPTPTPPPPGLCEGHPWEAGDGGTPPSLASFPQGPYAVSTRDFSDVRLHGGYRYSVRLFVPSGGDALRPGLIFMHGFQLDGPDFYWYGEALASYGYFVLIPTAGDSLTNPRRHSDLADDIVELVSWMIAQSDEPGTLLHERLDTERIGAGGHSRGGKSAILAAIRDDRIRASFNLDPVDANPPFPFAGRGYTVVPDEMAEFRIPGAFLGTGKGGSGFTPCAPRDTNYTKYFASSAGPSYQFTVENAGHNDFAQRCLDASGFIQPTACSACQDGDHPEWNVALAAILSAAFHAVHLDGDDSCRDWLTGPSMESLAPWVTVSTRNLSE